MTEDPYRARERAVLETLAWQTVTDANATHRDKLLAKSRLEGACADVSRLSDAEITVLAILSDKACARVSNEIDLEEYPAALRRLASEVR
jgi:hypothetical protein